MRNFAVFTPMGTLQPGCGESDVTSRQIIKKGTLWEIIITKGMDMPMSTITTMSMAG